MKRMRQRLGASFNGAILIALCLPLIGILPMFGGGLANGADAPFHAHRIYALARLIEAGDLYPRWVPWFHLGYGYPIFNFYPPGATQIGAWLHLAGFDVVSAYNLTCALAWSVGSLGMYLLSRRLFPMPLPWLACALWVYAPSRFFEFWWQGSLAQLVATSLLPFVFYGILRCRAAPCGRSSLCLALTLALVILSHAPTSYICAIFALPCCLLAIVWRRPPKRMIKPALCLALGLALAAGLSAIYWLPALLELKYIKIGGGLPDTIAFLTRQFLQPAELFSLPQLIDRGDATLIMPRTLGLVGGVLGLAGLVALVYRRQWALALLLLAGMSLALFFTLEPSLDLWLRAPGFRNLRFPERILRMASLILALLGAASLYVLPRRFRLAAAVAASALVMAQALPLTHPRDDDRRWAEVTAWDEIEMEHRERNWGTTSYNEYLPIYAKTVPYDTPETASPYIDDPLRIRVSENQFDWHAGNVEYAYLDDGSIWISVADKTFFPRFRQFFFPGWRITRDGEPYLIDADRWRGVISTRLEPGEHVLRLTYVGTPTQHRATLLSLVCLGLCLAVGWHGSRGERHPICDSPSKRAAALCLAAILAIAALNVTWLQHGVFHLKSPADSPAYMQSRLGHAFDDAIELIGYSLESTRVSADMPVNLRLYWRRLAEDVFDYEPVVQLNSLSLNDAWAVSQRDQFEGGDLAALDSTRFMSDGHRLQLVEGAPAWAGRISVQLRRSDIGEMARLSDGSHRALLPDIIQIDAAQKDFEANEADIDIGGVVKLRCIDIALQRDALQATLHWHVTRPPLIDYHLFFHGMAGDAIAAQADGPPLGIDYPTSLWREDQRLISRHSLPLDATIGRAAIGLYDPVTGARVQVGENGETGDRIWLSLEAQSCAG